jgi:tRNA-2-methylthio-N6-dimethylallyladenosine synthase
MINGVEGVERIRFVTSHPKDLGDDLICSMRDLEKVCEHIHLPLQSGSDRMLQLMNRKYGINDYVRKVEKLRNEIPGVSITTDIIAGFPSERPSDHEATLNALREIKFDGIFAFKYSSRPLTKAAEMEDQLPEEIRSERLSDVLDLQDEISECRNRALEGSLQEILVDSIKDRDSSVVTGRTGTNKIVSVVASGKASLGSFLTARIVRGYRHSLQGEFIH